MPLQLVSSDWRERHKFLKCERAFGLGQLSVDPSANCHRYPVELPLDIHSDFATYHTQFGIVRRPTHRNTSWDAAK